VGLVGSGLGFPRGLAEHHGDIYITDLGSRLPGRGRVLRVRLDRPWKPTIVLSRLDRPGAIVSGPDGYLYVAESSRIFRFNPDARDPAASVEPVLTGLPTTGLHNLPGLAIARDGGLFVSIGAASDNCEDEQGRRPRPDRPCPELSAHPPRGSILYLPPDRQRTDVYATGIRNALALLPLPNGVLLAASNGRDNIDQADPRLSDERLPHDLLLMVRSGDHFGWPYCFDLDRPSPEFPNAKCAKYTKPALLLPPHAAPLSMLLYRGSLLPGLRGTLVLAYHGYRSTGHRIVAFHIAANGSPIGAPVDLVSGWTAVRNLRPQGAPVAMLELADGSILILEDHNGTLLRLAAS
jgi:glucose/arabinose dehydrogenase